MKDDELGELSFLADRLREDPEAPAIAWRGGTVSFGWLLQSLRDWLRELEREGVHPGMPVVLHADYSPVTVSLLFALVLRDAIICPLLPATVRQSPELIDLVDPAFILDVATDEGVTFTRRRPNEPHGLYKQLIQRDTPGLVLFTSGSTGVPKGVVHDFSALLRKFKKPRPPMVTLNFLLFDHWGGLNTLFHCLSSGSLVVLPENRTVEHICDLIELHKVELFPATPTFLNLLLVSHSYEGRNFENLRLITYGAEPMPSSSLRTLRAVFPNVELRQTYGLIELGVLRARSQSSDSLWVKIGGEGYDIRVVDGILQIKAESAMLGYLNAPSPFTTDGYFVTGDRVEVDGEYLRFLGRDSDLINVGGQKVYPAEVEAVLLECQSVVDAIVYGEKHPITGQIVCAEVQMHPGLDEISVRRQIREFCRQRIESFKIPVKIEIVKEILRSDRWKKKRHGTGSRASHDR